MLGGKEQAITHKHLLKPKKMDWNSCHFLPLAAFHLDDMDVVQDKQVSIIITELNIQLAREKLKEDSVRGGMVGCRLRLCVIPIN